MLTDFRIGSEPTKFCILNGDDTRELIETYIEESRNDPDMQYLGEHSSVGWFIEFVKDLSDKIISDSLVTTKEEEDKYDEPNHCFLIDEDFGDGDDNTEIVLPVIVPSDEDELRQIAEAQGFGFLLDYSDFLTLIQNGTEEEINEYCNSTEGGVTWSLVRYYSCTFFKWLYVNINETDIPSNEIMQRVNGSSTDYIFSDDIVKLMENLNLPLNELYNESQSIFNTKIHEIKAKIDSDYPNMYTRLQSTWDMLGTITTKMSEGGFKMDNLQSTIDVYLAKFIPEMYELKYQMITQDVLYKIHHEREEYIAEHFKDDMVPYSDDPGAIMRMRKKVEIFSSARLSVYTSKVEKSNFLGSTCPVYEGFAPWENNLFNILDIRSHARFWYLVIFVWIFGINADETKCRPRFWYWPSSVYNCHWPKLCLGNPFYQVVRDLFPGWDPQNSQCEDYNTFGEYIIGLFSIFSFSRPPNLIPCLLINSFLLYLILHAVVIVGGLIFIIYAFIITGWISDIREIESELDMEDMQGELVRKERRDQHKIFEIDENLQILQQNQEAIQSQIDDMQNINETVRRSMLENIVQLKNELGKQL